MKCAVDRKVCLESQMLTSCDTIRLPKLCFKDSKVAYQGLLVNILACCVFILCIFKCICTASGKACPLSFVFVATVSILFVMLIKVLAVEENNACSH